jgi:hypothetical protein
LADEVLVNAILFICLAAALGFWLGYFYWAYRMIKGRKEGVRPFGRALLWNPFNICFRPSLLTEDGLRARKWFFVCTLGFSLCILVGLVVGGAFRAP